MLVCCYWFLSSPFWGWMDEKEAKQVLDSSSVLWRVKRGFPEMQENLRETLRRNQENTRENVNERQREIGERSRETVENIHRQNRERSRETTERENLRRFEMHEQNNICTIKIFCSCLGVRSSSKTSAYTFATFHLSMNSFIRFIPTLMTLIS